MLKIGDIVKHNQVGTQYKVVDVTHDNKLKFDGYRDMGYFKGEDYTLVQSSPQAANWRIESDGTTAGTKVYLNDVQVNNVVSVSFYAQADQVPVLTLELNGSRVA